MDEWGVDKPAATFIHFYNIEGDSEKARAARTVLAGRRTGELYVLRWAAGLEALERGLAAFGYRYDRLHQLSKYHRMALHFAIMRRMNSEEDNSVKFSNGLTAVFYALASGAPAVILTGIDPHSDGHFYNDALTNAFTWKPMSDLSRNCGDAAHRSLRRTLMSLARPVLISGPENAEVYVNCNRGSLQARSWSIDLANERRSMRTCEGIHISGMIGSTPNSPPLQQMRDLPGFAASLLRARSSAERWQNRRRRHRLCWAVWSATGGGKLRSAGCPRSEQEVPQPTRRS